MFAYSTLLQNGFLLAGLVYGASTLAQASDVDLPRYPSVSPDGTEVVFSWRGDLWLVPIEGGDARRLTVHPGVDSRSDWSPDGREIAFESDRDGYRNIWVVNADGSGVRQVVQSDRSAILSDYGAGPGGTDEPMITYDSRHEGDFYRSSRPYQVSASGGVPERVHDAFGTSATRSPSGEAVLFERGGSSWTRRHYRGPDSRDVWLHTPDGEFVQLTSWEGNDGSPQWLDDDTMIFMSDRANDTVNLYRQAIVPGVELAEPLTSFEDRDITAFDLSDDGSTAIIQRWDTLYALDLTDPSATPVPLSIQANQDGMDRVVPRTVSRNVTEAALSPDGKVMAFVAYGDVWVRNVADSSPTRRVTHTLAHDQGIAWSPDGLSLYFTSDDNGTNGIYQARVLRTRTEVRDRWSELMNPPQEDESEESSDADADGVDARKSTLDVRDNASTDNSQKDPGSGGASDPPAEEAATQGTEETEEDVEEDAEEEVEEKAEKPDPMLDPDRWHDAIEFEIEPVVLNEFNNGEPAPSPDGTMLAFRRGGGDIHVLDLATGEDRLIREEWDFFSDFIWSPDSRMIALSVNDRNFNSDIWLIPVDDPGAAVNVSRHPDNDMSPSFSADGRILAFSSERKDEEYDVYRVYLDKSLEGLHEPELDEYYKEAVKAAKKRKPLPVDTGEDDEKAAPGEPDWTLSLDDAYLRVRRMSSLPGSERQVMITPAGDAIVYSNSGGGPGDAGLWSVKWDGTGAKRLGSGSMQHMTLSGDKLVTVNSGRGGWMTMPSGSEKTIGIDAEIEIDLEEQSSRKFAEATRIFGEVFYHPEMNGVDWDRLTDDYQELASRAWTGDEFNWVAARLLGELNASHTGIRSSGYSTSISRSQGRLGTVHAVHPEGGFEVIELVENSPAAVGPMPLEPGDVILSIDGKRIAEGETIEGHLRGKVGEEVIVGIRRMMPQDDAEAEPVFMELDAILEPISASGYERLRRAQRERTAQTLVDEASDGRIGYLHIESMNQASLDEFERDLYAVADGRDGLIIDVRNNGGGWTADRLLSSITARPHAYTVPRGSDPGITHGYPQDRLFIQRYVLPINMLCNEKSFSNAEITSHAFKTLGRGTLIGEQTYGGVISTGGTSLVDGTSIRLPFRGWYLLDGTDMENNGAIPDIVVKQTPQDESRGHDEQLQVAIEDLMLRLPDRSGGDSDVVTTTKEGEDD
ncbi:MAG: S41 family peptidase [Planctomycetota bacterium]|nr:S41 family peptidase [Planctomycetota bacterium]